MKKTTRTVAPATSSRTLLRVGIAILTVLIAVAVAAPLLAPFAPDARVAAPFSPPGLTHPLGSDDVGHDLLSQLLHGARTSLLVGTVAAVAATLLGSLIGTIAGAARGPVDTVLMRLIDVTLSLPFLPLMLVIGAFMGPGLGTQILVIATVMWAGAARELRAQVLSLREHDHVQAAVAMGASPAYVIRHHLLPGVAPLVAPQFVLAAKRAVMFEATLSFLGLGAAGVTSWGTMLYHAHRRSAFLTDAWRWWVLPPGLAIAATVIGLALVGYGIEQRLRPQLGRSSRSPGRRDLRPRRPAARTQRPATTSPLLWLDDVSVTYGVGARQVTALAGVSLGVDAGERVGVVGASGSGKSTLVLAAAGLLPASASLRGQVRVDGRDLADRTAEERRRLRGRRIALLPQQAAAALNPVMRVGDQIVEAVRLHQPVDRGTARRRAAELLDAVELGARCLGLYPHQLSGGMRQRAVLAIVLANDPELLILDEPTTGLDVVTQVELLELLQCLHRRHGTALLTVSHDPATIAALADRVAVVDAGRLVREGPTPQVLAALGPRPSRSPGAADQQVGT